MLLQIESAEILAKLIEHGPVVTVLIFVMWRDSKKIQTLEAENKELHNYIRESEKSAIGYVKDLNAIIQRIFDNLNMK